MELPFDPAFCDNITAETGDDGDEMSKYWPSCRIGRLKVYDNGKMVLKMAGVKFDVTEGQPCGFRQEVHDTKSFPNCCTDVSSEYQTLTPLYE